MADVLFENWTATKDALVDGLSGNKKAVMETILENTKRGITESASIGSTSAGNIATLNKVILPVIRRVMPTVIANELVGVQPMTGPVGQIHTLRVRYAETAAGATAGDEALSPFAIANGYSGNAATARAEATSVLEGQAGRKLNIQVLKQTVEAKTRKLAARWTFEAAQDAQSMHGLDVEAEIMAALAQEITAEIDQEVITSLTSLAGPATGTYDQNAVSGTATFVGDEHASLAILVNKAANDIAARTRRGAGNWMIVSPTMLTVLQSATTSAFARTTEGPFEAPTNTKFVGTLNGSMRVYVNQYATSDDILIGYKGSNETDAAAFYCPYIPLMSSGTVLDPNTFEPVVSFMSRYGYVELSNQASSLGNASDYLNRIAVTTANLSFT
jgi:hypothetical protein